MNIIQILWKLGYDVIESDSVEKKYVIQYSAERRRRMRAKTSVDDKELIKFFHVTIGDVQFNEVGDLYVEFIDINTHEILDAYEYNNMQQDELY